MRLLSRGERYLVYGVGAAIGVVLLGAILLVAIQPFLGEESPEAIFREAEVHYQGGEYAQAAELYEDYAGKIAEHEDGDQSTEALAWMNAGEAWQRAEHSDKALMAYQRAFIMGPESGPNEYAEATMSLGELLAESNEYTHAREYHEKALSVLEDWQQSQEDSARADVVDAARERVRESLDLLEERAAEHQEQTQKERTRQVYELLEKEQEMLGSAEGSEVSEMELDDVRQQREILEDVVALLEQGASIDSDHEEEIRRRLREVRQMLDELKTD